MNSSTYFEDLFESIQGYRKIVLLMFLNQKVQNFLNEIGFSKNDIVHLSLEFKNIIFEQHENYLEYVKDQEESIIDKISNK